MVGNLPAVPASILGIGISPKKNITLGDGIPIATALEAKLPVVVSSDRHISRVEPEYGLIVENPLKH